jgi:LytS/YehU family sensor histidine kinase
VFSFTTNWVTYHLFSIENKEVIPFIAPFPPFLLVTTIGLTLRLIGDKQRKEKDIAERETENLKSELSFLRSQVSPHFLFNVMNNVVSLARLQPQKVEPTLIKLSSLMRYMLYESDEKKVEIRKEVEYLQAYIDLQALRFGDDVKVTFQQDIQDNILIEPMLFIPFVENAFKHGIGLLSNPEINIFIQNKDNVLIFKCLNKFENNSNDSKDDASGIGLRNVQRRLELLYPEQHDLKISKNGDWFEVNLEICFQNIEKIV